jgi:hypothetical protein
MKISKAINNYIIGFVCIAAMITFTRCEYDFYDDIVNNPYRELRIPPWSTMSQVKQKYKELVKMYHPDKTKNRNSHDKFLAIQQAYERIKNRRKSENTYESSYDYDENDESEEDNSFYDAISDTIKIISGCGVSMTFIYFVSYMCYKFYALIYGPLFSMITSFVIIDRLFPHYFKNWENQVIYSFVFGIILIFSKKIMNAILTSVFGDKNSFTKTKQN